MLISDFLNAKTRWKIGYWLLEIGLENRVNERLI